MTPEVTFDFSDLAPKEQPVRIGTNRYVLREASADAARKWRNVLMASTKIIDGKVSGVGNVADSEAMLVSLCLFQVDAAGAASEKPVHQGIVLSWPNRYVKPMFEWVKKVSDLEEKEELDTEESLTSRIAELQEKLQTLRNTTVPTAAGEASEDQSPTT